MPRITVDFSDVKEFEALPKGEYDAIIAKASWVEPESDEKFPYINLEFDVPVQDGIEEPRKLWSILSTSPKALWRMKQVFENLGIYMEELDIDVADDETNAVLSPELVGLPCRVAVSKRIYEGRDTNQVDAITAPETAGAKKTPGKPAKAPAAKPAGRQKSFK